MTGLEIEVKFLLEDVEATRRRIHELGSASSGRVFETNIRFENADRTLSKQQSLLRLRRDKKATLTFKSRPETPADQFKIHREIEVEVSDFETTARILDALGYRREQVYEKYRETFAFEGVLLCLDTMPFGDFLEIEGDRKHIRTTAGNIGLAWEDRILKNYLELFALLKTSLGLSFEDVTFSNFSSLDVDAKRLTRLLRGETCRSLQAG